jgi:hypothetical protein
MEYQLLLIPFAVKEAELAAAMACYQRVDYVSSFTLLKAHLTMLVRQHLVHQHQPVPIQRQYVQTV